MLLAFPGFDQKQRQRTRCIDRETCNPSVDAPEAILAPMRIPTVGPQCATTLGNGGEAAQRLADVGFYLRWKIRPTRRQTQRKSEEHTSELQSLIRTTNAVISLKK